MQAGRMACPKRDPASIPAHMDHHGEKFTHREVHPVILGPEKFTRHRDVAAYRVLPWFNNSGRIAMPNNQFIAAIYCDTEIFLHIRNLLK